MGKFADLSGDRYGRLTVLELAPAIPSGRVKWICRCDCGVVTSVLALKLRTGYTKSCGCLKSERRRLRTGELTEGQTALIAFEDVLQVLPADAARFLGLSRSTYWNYRRGILTRLPPRIRFSIEAHLLLTPQQRGRLMRKRGAHHYLERMNQLFYSGKRHYYTKYHGSLPQNTT